jgi:hypothetical protein
LKSAQTKIERSDICYKIERNSKLNLNFLSISKSIQKIILVYFIQNYFERIIIIEKMLLKLINRNKKHLKVKSTVKKNNFYVSF